jgi:hypothetical protein
VFIRSDAALRYVPNKTKLWEISCGHLAVCQDEY